MISLAELLERRELGIAGAALLRYWASLPKDRLVPRRQDFDPIAIPRLLPVITLAEWRSEGRCITRVFGTELARRNGCDLTGGDFLDLFPPSQRVREAALLKAMLGQPCGSIALREVDLASGRRFVTRMVTLPLRGRDGSVSLLVSTYEPAERLPELAPEESGIAALQAGERIFLNLGAGVPAPANSASPGHGVQPTGAGVARTEPLRGAA